MSFITRKRSHTGKPNIKNSHRLAAAVAAAALFASACASASGSGTADTAAPGATTAVNEPAGDPAPATPFVTFDGVAATLATYAGKPIVVNFWASWCPSCVAEMSATFRPVQQDVGADVTFLGMNISDERDLAVELLEETGVQWISAEDPDGELYVELGGIAMPFTVFIDADGSVVKKQNGPLTEGQLRDIIAAEFG